MGHKHELNLARYFSARKLQYAPVVFSNYSEAVSAYRNGRCDGLSGDATQLASERLKFSDPSAHIIMPEIISREALSLLVREGDQQWREVVTWVHNALLIAEFHGITSSNAANASLHGDPEARRLLGFDPQGIGTNLGLGAAWARNAIRAVGNYAQVYNRNLGANSAFKLPRGVNALFVNGGLHFPPPL